MAQRVKEMVSDEIIDEDVVKKQVREAKKHLDEESEKVPTIQPKADIGIPTESVGNNKKTSVKKSVKPAHGKKYFAAKAKIEKDKVYTIDEAIDKVLETNASSFDATVEVHAKLAVTNIRGTLVLPSGAPKQKKVVEVTDANVEDIISKVKANKLDFDILVAAPSTMLKLAAVAKILGPKGLMPSPKSGTVVENTKEAVEEFKSGKVEYKQDDQKNIHLGIAKVSWGKEKIKENLSAILKVMPKNKVSALCLASTMGPSVKVEIPK